MRRARWSWSKYVASVVGVALLAWGGLPVREAASAAEGPLPEAWNYREAMQKAAAGFTGEPGVVLHVGDSLTYSSPYGQWARQGQGKTADDAKVLQWMHTGRDDRRDGWWLARFDHPDGGRSHTACSGLRMDELVAGGKRGLPSLGNMLADYRPQIVILLCGTNDATARRTEDAYLRDAQRAVELILAQHAVCILSTLPPHPREGDRVRRFNIGLRKLAESQRTPLIDLEREILSRRPDDWNGTLLSRDDVHLSASTPNATSVSPPTDANLRECGYLLRGWLSVRKIAEVKGRVWDEIGARTGAPFRPSSSVDAPRPKPRGTPIRLPVTRDTRVSSYPGEEAFSPGGASQIKLKSNQEMGLVDFEASSLRGKVITGGELHVQLPNEARERLRRVTIAGVCGAWVEGTAGSSTAENGASSFAWRRNPDVPWTTAGGDLTAAVFGATGGVWSSAEASPPDEAGRQIIPIDARVLSARVAGLVQGLLVFDDTGSEWTRDGERVTMRDFPNRYFFSREAGKDKAPYLVVYIDGDDTERPLMPRGLTAQRASGRVRDVLVHWESPPTDRAAPLAGFRASLDGRDVPAHLVPFAPQASVPRRLTMLLKDADLGNAKRLTIRTVDGAGNESEPVDVELPTRAPLTAIVRPTAPVEFSAAGPLPQLDAARIAVLDSLDKLHPTTGLLVGRRDAQGRDLSDDSLRRQTAEELSGNHLWSARDRTIRLHAAGGEIISFQVAVLGNLANLQPSLQWDETNSIQSQFSRARHVATHSGPQPDPLVPLNAAGLSVPDVDDRLAEQICGALHVEMIVPPTTTAGAHRGKLTLRSGEQSLELTVTLEVWPFTLPNELRFVPEMNCYGLPRDEREYYRVAHWHRTVLNRLPYHQNGSLAEGGAPKLRDGRLDFQDWDARFGPLLDGEAFADLPRGKTPVDCFYLPLHENWPSAIERHYNGSYWADEAFTDEYRRTFVEATRQFALHAHQRGWLRTRFHGFLNNKVMYKSKGWSRGSAPWLLDEPAHFQDYWALRYFGLAFHEGVKRARGEGSLSRFLYRCDISRPQWQRDTLDGLLDYNVVSSGAFQTYRSLVLTRKSMFPHEVVIYGAANDPATANVHSAAWCLDAWLAGADGVVPWQTVGTDAAWQTGEATCLFYPGKPAGLTAPAPSVRLKAFLRGQQDVEYLANLAQRTKMTPLELSDEVRRWLPLQGERRGTGHVGDEDAGTMDYGRLTPRDLWRLRMQVARLLSAP